MHKIALMMQKESQCWSHCKNLRKGCRRIYGDLFFICAIHEKMSSKHIEMLKGDIKKVNYVKSQTLKNKRFKLMPEVVESHHLPLFLLTEVR